MKLNRYKRNRWKSNRLKKDEWYLIFARNGDWVRFGYKYYSKIDEEYIKDKSKYMIVIMNDNEIYRGSKNNFNEYFKMFKNISGYFKDKAENKIIFSGAALTQLDSFEDLD